MQCKICEQQSNPLFKAKVMGKYEVQYYQCGNCQFVQTEDPYWLEEAYNSPINHSDTGIVLRNSRLSRIVGAIIICFFDKNKEAVDYAGGFGMFTRMMRDAGFDFYWMDPYVKNELSRGFEAKEGKKYHIATTFESFEHFDQVFDEMKKITNIADNIIASTEMIPLPPPALEDWWYYAPEHGQHIAFYTKPAFKILAKKLGMHYYNLDNVHILSKKKLNPLTSWIFKMPFSKHFFYLLSFFLFPFQSSKTFSDMELMKPANHDS